MKYSLTISPQAEKKVNNAFHTYQNKAPPKGMDLLSALDDKLEVIQQNPYLYQVRFDEVRTVQLKRFPYTVVYRIKESEVQIINFAHAASDSNRW